jgi:predicted CoA-binding protein
MQGGVLTELSSPISLSLVPIAPASSPNSAGAFYMFIWNPVDYCEGMTTSPSIAFRRKILNETKTIVMVGVSPNPVRPSHFVGRYLSLKGYTIIPVNPGLAGKHLFGGTVVARLADIPPETPVDMLDIFRRSEHVLPIVQEAIERLPSLKTIWMQIGIQNPEAANLAEAAGLQVIQNHCPKIEYQRLHSELRMAGFNTGIISSRLELSRPQVRPSTAENSN